ncbi:MAG: carboxymuconolactone decarboxylase family protein [Lysobacteraceae bacterium]
MEATCCCATPTAPADGAQRASAARRDLAVFGLEAMQAMAALDRRVARAGLEHSLIALVRIRISHLNGCVGCLDGHVADARRLGESDRRLATLQAWYLTPFFTDRERAALAWAEALTLIAGYPVTDELRHQVGTAFTPSDIADLTLAITTANAWNRFAIALGKMPG